MPRQCLSILPRPIVQAIDEGFGEPLTPELMTSTPEEEAKLKADQQAKAEEEAKKKAQEEVETLELKRKALQEENDSLEKDKQKKVSELVKMRQAKAKEKEEIPSPSFNDPSPKENLDDKFETFKKEQKEKEQKKEMERAQSGATKEFYKKYPQYSPEKDKDNSAWKELMDNFGYVDTQKKGVSEDNILADLERAHNALMGKKLKEGSITQKEFDMSFVGSGANEPSNAPKSSKREPTEDEKKAGDMAGIEAEKIAESEDFWGKNPPPQKTEEEEEE